MDLLKQANTNFIHFIVIFSLNIIVHLDLKNLKIFHCKVAKDHDLK